MSGYEAFLIKKENGVLQFNNMGGYESRNPSTFWCIQQADMSYNWPDFKQIKIDTGDVERGEDRYTYSKQNNDYRTIPDFTFHNWPQVGVTDYNEMIKELDTIGRTPFEVNKVGWIGSADLPFRAKMVSIGNTRTDICDFIKMNWIRRANKIELDSTQYLSMPQLVKKYSILIDIEGGGWSARLKWLFWSHRPVILIDRPHKEFYFKYLKEWEHYIPVKRDMSDLIEKVEWCLQNYEQALRIAENAYEFSKQHLTREACYRRWNELIMDSISNQ